MGDKNQIAKIYERNLEIFFSRITGSISTECGTKYPWVKGIHLFLNKEPRSFDYSPHPSPPFENIFEFVFVNFDGLAHMYFNCRISTYMNVFYSLH